MSFGDEISPFLQRSLGACSSSRTNQRQETGYLYVKGEEDRCSIFELPERICFFALYYFTSTFRDESDVDEKPQINEELAKVIGQVRSSMFRFAPQMIEEGREFW